MAERTCKKCGRPLTEEESKYCLHCNAISAERFKKIVKSIIGVAGTIGVVVVAVKNYLSDKKNNN